MYPVVKDSGVLLDFLSHFTSSLSGRTAGFSFEIHPRLWPSPPPPWCLDPDSSRVALLPLSGFSALVPERFFKTKVRSCFLLAQNLDFHFPNDRSLSSCNGLWGFGGPGSGWPGDSLSLASPLSGHTDPPPLPWEIHTHSCFRVFAPSYAPRWLI